MWDGRTAIFLPEWQNVETGWVGMDGERLRELPLVGCSHHSESVFSARCGQLPDRTIMSLFHVRQHGREEYLHPDGVQCAEAASHLDQFVRAGNSDYVWWGVIVASNIETHIVRRKDDK